MYVRPTRSFDRVVTRKPELAEPNLEFNGGRGWLYIVLGPKSLGQ